MLDSLFLVQPLNEQISRLHEELAAERLSREVMDERKTKEIKSVESAISLDLTQEKRVSAPIIRRLRDELLLLFIHTAVITHAITVRNRYRVCIHYESAC